MTREEALKIWLPIIDMSIDNMPELKEAFDMAIKALEKEPTTKNETLVSLDAYKQVAWERDIAIQQLHELGYEFGQKIEPITKNDLGVRKFEEIVVEYPPEDLCTYPEHKGKPYFGIKYKEGNDYIIGYGTYNPKVLSRYLTDYFMPSVTPQEPVLDKIFCIAYPLSIMSTPELEHKAIMQIAEMLEPLCLPESEDKE